MPAKASAVFELLGQVWEPAKASAEQERQALVEQATALGEPTDVEPWDWYNLPRKYASPGTHSTMPSETVLQPGRDACRHVRLRGRLFGVQFVEQTGVTAVSPGCAFVGSAPRR